MSKTSTLYLLFNHTLTSHQEEDAYANLPIDTINTFPKELLLLWGNIPVEDENLSNYLKPIESYIISHLKPGDYLFVQGDAGATYAIVELAKQQKITPIYATTKRVSSEKVIDGKPVKTSIFSHVRFREYQALQS